MKLPFFPKPTAPSDDAPTSRRVECLLDAALSARATDLHFEPEVCGGGRLRLRVDGAFVRRSRRLPNLKQSLLSDGGIGTFGNGERTSGENAYFFRESSIFETSRLLDYFRFFVPNKFAV